MMKRVLSLAFFTLVAQVVCAALPIEPTPTPGKWCDKYLDAREYADAHHMPLVLIWSSTEEDGSMCHYCQELKTALDDPSVNAWMGEKGYVFCVVTAENGMDVGARNQGAYTFASTAAGLAAKKVTAWPIVCLYWNHGTVEAVNYCGRSGKMGTRGTLRQQFMDCVDNYFGDRYKPAVYFPVGGTEGDRLEAVIGRTTSVAIPLKRHDATAAAVYTLIARYPAGGSVEKGVSFAIGEEEPSVWPTVTVPGVDAAEAGDVITLSVVNGEGEEVSTSSVYLMEEPENNPKNPLWLGARTASTLKAGEWTMDLSLAQACAVRDQKPVLVLVGGSLWCPDCVKVDHYLVDTDSFRGWLTNRGVYCVAIDVPNVASGKTTSLMTYDPYSTSDRYVTATVPNQARVQSGAGYRSRNMIDAASAKTVADRNVALITNDVQHGGLCRPENMDGDNTETGPFKTGIPCLIMVRPDGKVCGRIFQFNNVSPGDTTALAAYLQRMDELLDAAADGDEESNADWRTAGRTLGRVASVTDAAVSAVDLRDVYRLTKPGYSVRGTVSLKALEDAPDEDPTAYRKMTGENNVKLVVYRVVDGEKHIAATATGNIFKGVSLSAVCGGEDEEDLFVEVNALGTVDSSSELPSETFALEREGDSTVAYALDVDFSYRTSVLEFAKTEVTVNEKDAGPVEITLTRSGGMSGTVRAHVAVDEEATTAVAGLHYQWTDQEVVWTDGDTAPKSVWITVVNDSVYDGDRTVGLTITETSGPEGLSVAGPDADLALTIKEDDKAVVGKLKIAETTPAMAAKMKVVAVEGETIDIGIERVNGSSKPFGAMLDAAAGTLSSNYVFWVNNDRAAMKHVALTLPELWELAKGDTFKVTLKPDQGISADSSGKTLTVQVLSRDCPKFEVSERAYSGLYRYVKMATDEIGITSTLGGTLSVKKTGTLPSGVTVTLDTEGSPRLVVSGAPTAAKTCEAVYQVYEKVGKTTYPGLTVKLVFSVGDVTKPGEGGAPAVNPTVATSRTYENAMVVDPSLKRLVGTMTVTIPPTGKASAKYTGPTGKVSLSAKNWASCETASGLLTAELTGGNAQLTLAVRRDGTVGYEFQDGAGLESSGELEASVWNKDDTAEAFGGQYSVDCPLMAALDDPSGLLPTGDAWMTLKMTSATDYKKGKMTYAVGLPNGKTFSGSGTLVRRVAADETVTAVLPVLCRSTTDFFSTVPEIAFGAAALYASSKHDHQTVSAAGGVVTHWAHTETKLSEAGHSADYLLYGAYYDVGENIRACAEERYDGVTLWLQIDDSLFDEVIGNLPVALTASSVGLEKNVANPNAVKLTFTRSTGKVSGSFKFLPQNGAKQVTAKYHGVLLPGWGGCGECDPGSVFRPLVVGAFYFTDKLTYQEEVGGKLKDKTLSVVRGGSVKVDEAKQPE